MLWSLHPILWLALRICTRSSRRFWLLTLDNFVGSESRFRALAIRASRRRNEAKGDRGQVVVSGSPLQRAWALCLDSQEASPQVRKKKTYEN